MIPQSSLGKPEHLQVLVRIADGPLTAVFRLDHRATSAYLSGAPAYILHGIPSDPDCPPVIYFRSDIEVLGYYQDQCSMVECAGLEEAMRAMTIVGGASKSTVGSSELMKDFRSLSLENAAQNPDYNKISPSLHDERYSTVPQDQNNASTSKTYPKDSWGPPPPAPTVHSFALSRSSGYQG